MSRPFRSQDSSPSEFPTRPSHDLFAKEAPSELPHEQAEKLEAAAKRFSEKHDERSYTVLYRGVQSPLTRFVRCLGIRSHQVPDVVIQVCIVVWAQRFRFAGSYGNFLGLSLACARLEAKAWKRRETRWTRTNVLPTEAQETDSGFEDFSHSPSLEQIAIARELLNALPPRMRMVVQERFEGWEWKEIAERTGYSEDWLKETHAEAFKRLRRG